MSVSLQSERLLEIKQLAHFLYQQQPITVHEVLPFLGKTNFCASGHPQLSASCVVSFRVIC